MTSSSKISHSTSVILCLAPRASHNAFIVPILPVYWLIQLLSSLASTLQAHAKDRILPRQQSEKICIAMEKRGIIAAFVDILEEKMVYYCHIPAYCLALSSHSSKPRFFRRKKRAAKVRRAGWQWEQCWKKCQLMGTEWVRIAIKLFKYA